MKRVHSESESGQQVTLRDEMAATEDGHEINSKLIYFGGFDAHGGEMEKLPQTQEGLGNAAFPVISEILRKESKKNWKEGLEFLRDYGYDLDTLSPYTRISIQTDKSLTTLGGRSAPTAEKLLQYLEKHPTYRVAYRYKEEELKAMGLWCKYCGYVTDNLTHHQLNCFFKSEKGTTATYPADVYTFLDTTMDVGDQYEDGDVEEWMSLFGPFTDIGIPPMLGEEGDEEDKEDRENEMSSVPKPPISSEYADLVHIIEPFLTTDGLKQIPCSEEALDAIRLAMECAMESILKDCDEESIVRTSLQTPEKRVLVPPLLYAVNKKNPFLQFISNTGLQKPNQLD